MYETSFSIEMLMLNILIECDSMSLPSLKAQNTCANNEANLLTIA